MNICVERREEMSVSEIYEERFWFGVEMRMERILAHCE